MRKAEIGVLGVVAVAVGAVMPDARLPVGGHRHRREQRHGGVFVVALHHGDDQHLHHVHGTSTGGSKFCKPGDTQACYTGDAGVPDAGPCLAGSQTCDAEGNGFEGQCVGQVLPMPDNCASGLNLSCEVPPPACTGTPTGALTAGAQDDDRGLGIAVDAQGNAIVTGFFHDTVDFGGKTLTAADSGSDAFAAKYDPTGALLWAVRFGGNGDDKGTAVAVDASGDAYVTGWFSQQITLTGKAVMGMGIYVAKLHGADGTVAWGDAYTGDGAAHVSEGIAVGKDGSVAVAGYSAGMLTVGALSIKTSGGGDDDGFVLGLDGTGKPVWLKQINDGMGNNQQTLYGVAIDGADGSVVVTGAGQGDVNFDAPNGTAVTVHGDSQNILFAKYRNDGTLLWGTLTGEDGNLQHGYGVAIDATSAIYMTGDFQTQIQFDPTVTPISAATAGTVSMFVARFHDKGQLGWAESFPGTLGSTGYAVAVDAYSVVAGGYFLGTFSGGGASFPTLGTQDGIVLKLTSLNGGLLWARQLGGNDNVPLDYVAIQGVAFDPRPTQPLGRVVVTGEFSSQLDNALDPDAGPPPDAGPDAGADAGSDLGPFPSQGSNDVLVVRLDP